MRNIGLVAKHTFLTTVRSRSFWVVTLLVPAFLLIFQVYSTLQESEISSDVSAQETESPLEREQVSLPVFGLVDEAGLIKKIPPEFPDTLFLSFEDLEAGREAVKSGRVEQLVVLPADYLAQGAVFVYARDFQVTSSGAEAGLGFGGQNEWILPFILNYNLTGDAQLSAALRNPTPGILARYHALQPPAPVDEGDRALALLIGRIMPYIFYFILLFSSSYLLRSVSDEKENRTAEVLLLSVEPCQFMLGKVIGLGVVTLIQFLFWIASGYFALQRSASTLGFATLELTPVFLFWSVLFLLFGYLAFGGIMAAGGALAPNAREGNQLIWILILPLLPTLLFAPEFSENPNGILPLVLSLFPLSAPSAMVTRLAITEIPLWQILLSLAGLAVTTYLIISLAGRFFRAENLLSGASLNVRRFLKGWKET
jgi:ABC-2 type transport system permease protein